MTAGSREPTAEQQQVLRRFTEACKQDERVLAAFLGGSFARGTADVYSDLDIYVITTDAGYEGFFSERQAFMNRLGRPVYLEDFNEFGFDMVLFTFDDGVEGELALAPESRFDHIHGGPHSVLVDKKGLLVAKVFPPYQPAEEDQRRTLRKAIYGFWDTLSYFVRTIHRGQLWSAYGALNEMRMQCLKLARLRQDFTAEHTAYSGVERVVPESELRLLEATCCPLEPAAMLDAVRTLVEFYRQIAPSLAAQHGLTYPAELDRIGSARLEGLSGPGAP
jgi:lincosamide nucleotidyltransferase